MSSRPVPNYSIPSCLDTLTIAFSFALGLDKYHPSQRAPVLCRRCSVWKHGIGWLQDGIETVVEVGLQCQWVTVMMRCLKGKKIRCVQLRSAVIQEVKNARNELCKPVKLTELLILLSNVRYPFCDEQVSLYSRTDIANAMSAWSHSHSLIPAIAEDAFPEQDPPRR